MELQADKLEQVDFRNCQL